MASPNDPADVFIGYSRRDGRISPALFSTALKHASFMKLNVCYYDARLEAGEDWGEELEKHASGCKVFVAVVGKGWLEILQQRRENEAEAEYNQGVETTTNETQGVVTDWVYKELELALERDDSDPAELLIVCINDAVFNPANAAELFPPGKVRDYFSNPSIQMLQYYDDTDNEEFCRAVEKRLLAHHNQPAIATGVNRQASKFDDIEPWLRFLGRGNVWERLKEQTGMGMPAEAVFDARQDLPKSVALFAVYDDRKDKPRELIKGVSHHLYVEGQYKHNERVSAQTSSGDETWYVLNSFAWPSNAEDKTVLFRAILETLNVDSGATDLACADASGFVATLVEVYSNQPKGLSPCLYTTIRDSDKKNLELAKAFVCQWNQWDWSALPHRLVLSIGVSTADSTAFVQKHADTRLASEPVSFICADCIDKWREDFLENCLGVTDQQPPPDWWEKVDRFSPDKDLRLRYAEVEATMLK